MGQSKLPVMLALGTRPRSLVADLHRAGTVLGLPGVNFLSSLYGLQHELIGLAFVVDLGVFACDGFQQLTGDGVVLDGGGKGHGLLQVMQGRACGVHPRRRQRIARMDVGYYP